MRRRRSDIRSLGSIIPGKIPPALTIAMKISSIVKGWRSVAGDRLASCSKPVSIEDDLLVVVCENRSAANVLKMKGASLARSVNRKWNTKFKNIRVVVGKIEELKPEPERAPARKIEPSESSVKACLNYTSSKIEETDVAEALARLMATYMVRFPEKGDDRT